MPPAGGCGAEWLQEESGGQGLQRVPSIEAVDRKESKKTQLEVIACL